MPMPVKLLVPMGPLGTIRCPLHVKSNTHEGLKSGERAYPCLETGPCQTTVSTDTHGRVLRGWFEEGAGRSGGR